MAITDEQLAENIRAAINDIVLNGKSKMVDLANGKSKVEYTKEDVDKLEALLERTESRINKKNRKNRSVQYVIPS